jgi:signal transduction histidine kinase
MLVHVLFDMVVNALEATRGGGTVRMWIEEGRGSVSFCVWNQAVIAPDAATRIFQRNFTTKPGEDRGRGTWTMKLLGEDYLGARVGFSTSTNEGTVFRVKIPAGIAG